MSGKWMRKVGRIMSVGMLLGGATLFSAGAEGCNASDIETLLKIVQAIDEADSNGQLGDGSVRPVRGDSIQDGTSNTILFGEDSGS